MANGQKTHSGCIALSRKLARDLNVKFGDKIEIEGIGIFVFKDLMPKKWDYHDNGYRVDIWFPTLKSCKVFGVKRCQVKVIGEGK